MDWLSGELGKIGLLGIYGLVAGGIGSLLSGYLFPSWLQKRKSELDVEAEKIRFKLKRRELMFDRELIAAEAFFQFHDRVLGTARTPDPDWSEAQIIIAERFVSLESQLTKFLEGHGVAISESATKSIKAARNAANQGSFAVGTDTEEGVYKPGDYPDHEVQTYVDAFWASIEEARAQIRSDLDNGSMSENSLASVQISK